MGLMSRWALRAISGAVWLGFVATVFALWSTRPAGLAPTLMMVAVGTMIALMPFAIFPLVWEVTGSPRAKQP